MKAHLVLLPLLMTAGLATGCKDHPVFRDDEGIEHKLSPQSDELSLPYARGTRVGLTVVGAANHATWKITSDTPTVFLIESNTFDSDVLTSIGLAVAEGSAVIRLVDQADGKELHRATVNVKSANQARLYSHGAIRINGRDQAGLEAAEVTSAAVLTGGKAVFAVAYFRDGVRVYGRGIAETDTSTGLAITDETTKDVTANEWLFVTPQSDGAHTLVVHQGAQPLASLPITAVPAAGLTALSLVEEKVDTRNDGDLIWLLAKATDGAGHEVLGVYTSWTLDGAPQADTNDKVVTGDLYRYTSQKSLSKTVVATVGALSATATIKAKDGHVYDTTFLGCSAGGQPATSLASLLLIGLGLVAARRRAAI